MPPTAGRAGALAPGMLNAAALRGPVSTAALTTTATSTLTATPALTTPSLATVAQPLAYVPPEVPQPIQSSPPPHPPLQDSGTVQTLNPPPQPQLSPPQSNPPQRSAPGSGPPPGPSTGSGGPQGSGGAATQAPGPALGGAPQATRPSAVPLDTRPPPIPPPPSPGEPPLRHLPPPSWASPPAPPSVQEAQQQLSKLEQLIQDHNAKPPDPANWTAVADYNAEAAYYNAWAVQLQGQLDSSKVQDTPATAKAADVPSWTQPAPPQPPDRPPPPYTGPSTPELTDEVPLRTDRAQIERKYDKHASDFGISDPKGSAAFDKFADALKQFIHDPSTLHIKGTFKRQPVILNYNPDSGLCVVQDLDGSFRSAWKLSAEQAQNVLTRGSL
jgi:Colicin D